VPSELRLHPLSVLFGLSKSLKQFALPGLAVVVFGRPSVGPSEAFGGTAGALETWLTLLLIPAALHSVARYLSYRIEYHDTEMIVRSGLLFRNERHVPYARIQNVEAVRNVFHRITGMVEIRVETASGREPEAVITVVPLAALDDMRSRVASHRAAHDVRIQPNADAAAENASLDATEPSGPPTETLLRLTLRDLLLVGFIENRGLVIIGAIYGVLWELGPMARFWSRVSDQGSYGSGMVRDTFQQLSDGQWPAPERLAVIAAGLVGLLVFVRLVSMGWALVTLHGFRLDRRGDDLRSEYGLLTRVTSSIPLARIQTVTVRRTVWHRFTGRVSVRVETAGGLAPGAQGATVERQWVAPLLPASELPAFLARLVPGVSLDRIAWQGVHPRAFRRAVKPALLLAVLFTAGLSLLIGTRSLFVLPLLAAASSFAAWRGVKHLGWAADDDVVVFRSGWLSRALTLTPTAKIQVVSCRQSPFDRRTQMARVRVDTAGAGALSHRIDIPYLPRETAALLHAHLSDRAASTAFRW
jgi:putative membrane protein